MAPKTKNKEAQPVKFKPKTGGNRANTPRPTEEDIASRVSWENEIRAVVERNPQSVDQAITMLIDAVVQKLGAATEDQEHTKQFLQILFESDPGLKSLIQAALKL